MEQLRIDQYDDDQVMQLLIQDDRKGDKRSVFSGIYFNDRPMKELQVRLWKSWTIFSALKPQMFFSI
ncbi:hypothetical protein [Chryseobacterium jejuense]|uniref:hypothetical protein n=1 Tax=Chryseobacterium jejuense TaxID=445960 RepID=UPI003D1321F1